MNWDRAVAFIADVMLACEELRLEAFELMKTATQIV
jgi:hypothetical protein